MSLSMAPIVPAACVPWPLSSAALPTEARDAAGDVEIGVRGDPGVEHRHVDVDPLVVAVDPRDRVLVRVDAVDPGRDLLSRLLDRRRGDRCRLARTARSALDLPWTRASSFFAFLMHCWRFFLSSIFLHLRGAGDASAATPSPPGDAIVKASTGRSGTTAITAGLCSSPRIACGGNFAANPSMTCS